MSTLYESLTVDQKAALLAMPIGDALNELASLRQLLVDIDFVTRARVWEYGPADCIDRSGNPYPSQWESDLIATAKTFTKPSEEIRGRAG